VTYGTDHMGSLHTPAARRRWLRKVSWVGPAAAEVAVAQNALVVVIVGAEMLVEQLREQHCRRRPVVHDEVAGLAFLVEVHDDEVQISTLPGW
jgi:hypothetical protein